MITCKRDVFILLFLSSLIFTSCASLRKANIQIPKDIAAKTKVTQIPEEKQVEEKELNVTHHVLAPEQQQSEQAVKVEEKVSKKVKKGKPKQEKITQPTQIAVQKIIKNPFKVGEKIKLDLYYIGIRAASLTIEIMPYVTVDGKKAFHFQGTAETTSLMKYIYRVYDVIHTYVDYVHFVPLKMTLTMDESKQNISMALIYDHQKGKSTFWKKRIDSKGEVTETKREDDLTPYAQDIFSSLYFVRTNDLKIGDKLKFVIHDNGKNWNMTIDVIKRERVWTRLGEIDTLLLVPTVERDGEKFTKGKLNLWITDDDRKIPVKFEAQVRIGSMKGIIKDYIVPKEEK